MKQVMTMKSYISMLVRCLGLGFLAVYCSFAVAAPAHNEAVDEKAPTGAELIAFEAPGCRYCPIFRRDVAPTYAATRAGKVAPLRYLDINDRAADTLRLARPITMVPTVVLVQDGVEIGRIDGYVGRENMHHILNTLLPPD